MRHLVSTAALAALLLSGCSPDGGLDRPGSVQEVGARSSLSAAVHADPVWTATTAMSPSRSDHSATVLGSGQLLVAGGDTAGGDASAEIFDSIHRTWTPTGSLLTGRSRHGAVLLGSGKVLVVGGFGVAGVLSSAEIYDPDTGTWSPTGSLSAARYLFTTILLDDGKVLVAGGMSATPQTPMSSAELYDPDTGTWSPTGSLAAARYNHTATLLPSGKVLVSGGTNTGYQASAELFDPTTGAWNPTGSLATARAQHVAALLPSGKVLVAGGSGDGSVTLGSAELFDPAEGTWSATAPMATARHSHTATPLPNGRVLVAGGYGTDFLASTELYDPTTETWSSAGSLTTARSRHVATLLPFDRVLVTGGWSTYFPNTDLYAPSNTAPVALAQAVTTTEDTSLDVVLTATDAEGDELEYAIETPPAHGTLSGSAGNLTYTPAADFSGTDTFSFAANDGRDESLHAVVTITVTPVNDPPFAQGNTAATAEDSAVDVTLAAADVEGDALTYTIVSPASHGLLAGSDGGNSWTYAPEADFNGTDSFTFKANDGTADSNVATITITVSPVNDPPVAMPLTASVAENSSVAITLGGLDVDADVLAYALLTQPSHGTVTLVGQTATYTPTAGFVGTDTFTYTANDGLADSTAATVTVTVVNAPASDPKSGGGCSSATTGSVSPLGALLLGLLAIRRRPSRTKGQNPTLRGR